MVKLRLRRIGKKFNAFYRIVSTDDKSPVGSKFIEEIGYYNPHSKVLLINMERVSYWKNEGAKPSPTVKNLITKYSMAIENKKAKSNEEYVLPVKAKNTKSKKAKLAEKSLKEAAEQAKLAKEEKPVVEAKTAE